MSKITVEFTIGRDDEQIIKLTEAGLPLPLSGEDGRQVIDRIVLTLKKSGQTTITVDSQVPGDAGALTWGVATLDVGELKIMIGTKFSAQSAGDWTCRAYLYDTDHPNGLWHKPEMKVVATV